MATQTQDPMAAQLRNLMSFLDEAVRAGVLDGEEIEQQFGDIRRAVAAKSETAEVTPGQFDALAELLGGSDQLRYAVRLVLLDGLTHEEAAGKAGVSRPNVTRRVGQARAKLETARRAAGLTSIPEPS